MLLEVRGVKLGRGKVNQHTVASVTFTQAAKEVGVLITTAEKRLGQTKKFDALPAKAKKASRPGGRGW